MLFPDITSIHDIVPPITIGGVSNRSLPPEEQLYFRVRGISITDQDELDQAAALDAARHDLKVRMDNQRRRLYDLVKKKVVEIVGYQIAGPDGPRSVTDFDEFIRVAPKELVTWLFTVINSGESLSAAERKNLSRGSASGSTSLATAPASGTAPTATSASETPATATTAGGSPLP